MNFRNARSKPRTGRTTSLKWHRIYYLLAAFDVLIVLLGLILNGQIVRVYNQSIQVNQQWVARVESFDRFTTLADVVNASANDLFETGNIEAESLKVRAAFDKFNNQMVTVETELRNKIGEQHPIVQADVDKLPGDLAQIKSTMSQMTDEVDSVFSYYRRGLEERAEGRLAPMNRKYAELREYQLQLRDHVNAIQAKLFKEQIDFASLLWKLQLVIASFVLLMVALTTLYGRKIKNESESAAREKEHYLEKVQEEIIERKLVEASLRESEERYRDLFQNANDVVYTHDLAGRYTSVNKACEIVTGYTAEEALQMNAMQIIAPDCIDQAKVLLQRRVADSSTTAYRLNIIAKDGQRVTLEINSRVAFKNGTPIGIQGIARDITARVRLEQERQTIAEVTESVGVTSNLDELLNRIHQSLKNVIFAENCFVALYDKKSNLFTMEFFVDQ
ncbi:MAG: PAS domain-containing protein, partial [Pyrinomonadaceae bacterium]